MLLMEGSCARALPTVFTPVKAPLHTPWNVAVCFTGIAAWTPWDPQPQFLRPQEPTLPSAPSQNVTLPWCCLALLQLFLGLDPVGSSGLQPSRPVPEPRLFAVSPPCLQCTQPRGLFVCVVAVAVGMAWAQRAPWLLSAGSAVQALPCPCPCRGLCPRPSPSIRSPAAALRSLLNRALKPSQPLPSVLPLPTSHFLTLELLSNATSFPRACPHIRFPRRSCRGLCHPSCHGLCHPSCRGTAPLHWH